MGILVKTIRVSGLRGLRNIEVNLEQVTVLTGMNNSGKTTFLKAMQIALGNRQFITQDDFYISDNKSVDKIIVDICIVPVDEDGKVSEDFNDKWEALFTDDRIRVADDKYFLALRTVVSYDNIKATFKSKQYIMPEWPPFKDESGLNWHDTTNGSEKTFHFDEIPFFYVEAQRDILEDMKLRNSYLGKMISIIEYDQNDVNKIEELIKELNEQAIGMSPILSDISVTLKELESALDTSSQGIEITPFTKKIRDLNKGLSIHYSDKKDSFSMEYHGMGARSWSSLLTLKSFINYLHKNAIKEQTPFFPILAIEEPEAHLHPNAQKKLYTQIKEIKGQKIISTHSPYIVATAELNQIRNFYKDDFTVACGEINIEELGNEDIRKIERQVINSRGEIFFSKAIVFFEGETEEQALPIFAHNYFHKTPVELGIDFVGVGGHGNYLPFLRLAEALKIPWFIFSDAEQKVRESVKNQIKEANSTKPEDESVVFLTNGNKFEEELVADGYKEEIRAAIIKIEIPKCHTPQHEQAKMREIDAYDETKLLEIIDGSGVQYGPVVAECIIESQKALPSKVITLMEKLKKVLERNADKNEKD